MAARGPELDRLLGSIRPGDTLVIRRLDRLGRSMKQLLELIEHLESREFALVSLNEQIDTSTASGRLLLGIMASLAAFERGLLRERAMAGLEAARKQGRVGGRPKALSPAAAEAATGIHGDRQSVTQSPPPCACPEPRSTATSTRSRDRPRADVLTSGSVALTG